MTVTQQISEEVVATKFSDLSASIIDTLKYALLDDLGITFFGYNQVHRRLVEYARAIGGKPESTIMGDGMKVSCGLAAGINAIMGSDTDFEETGPGVHVFHPVAKTAIAVGERVGASGKELLAAIAICYELSGRFSRGIKSPASFIVFPSEARRHLALLTTTCAAKLLGLSADTMNQAIGTAWRTYIPPAFGLNLGVIGGDYETRMRPSFWSSQFGVHAALLAQTCGWGPRDILDQTDEDIYNLEDLTHSPSPFFSVEHELCLKPWIGSYGFMGALGSISDLIKEKEFSPEDIEQVTVEAGSEYVSDPLYGSATGPQDFFQASNSIGWSIANVIMGYEPGPDWVSENALQDSKRIEMLRKVKMVPGSSETNKVELRAKGQVHKAEIQWKDFPGGPNRRMSHEQIEAKFIRLAGPVIGEKYTNEIVEICRNLEILDDINKLTGYFAE